MTSFRDLHEKGESEKQWLRDRNGVCVRGTRERVRVTEPAPCISQRKVMRVTSRRRGFPTPVARGIELHVVAGIPVMGFRRAGSSGAVNCAAGVVSGIFCPEPGSLNVHGSARMGV